MQISFVGMPQTNFHFWLDEGDSLDRWCKRELRHFKCWWKWRRGHCFWRNVSRSEATVWRVENWRFWAWARWRRTWGFHGFIFARILRRWTLTSPLHVLFLVSDVRFCCSLNVGYVLIINSELVIRTNPTCERNLEKLRKFKQNGGFFPFKFEFLVHAGNVCATNASTFLTHDDVKFVLNASMD